MMDTELTSRRIPTRPSRRRLRRHEPRRHRRTLPSLGVLPTLCTLGNLVAGFAAIHYAAQDPTVRLLGGWSPLSLAGALIFLGIFLDAIDGSLARLTRSSSDLGAQLDSLADMVTFGIAPAFMTLRLVIIHLQSDGWIIGPEADTVLGRIIWGAARALRLCGGSSPGPLQRGDETQSRERSRLLPRTSLAGRGRCARQPHHPAPAPPGRSFRRRCTARIREERRHGNSIHHDGLRDRHGLLHSIRAFHQPLRSRRAELRIHGAPRDSARAGDLVVPGDARRALHRVCAVRTDRIGPAHAAAAPHERRYFERTVASGMVSVATRGRGKGRAGQGQGPG